MEKETLEEVANEYSKNRYSPEQGFPEEDYYISFLSFRAGAKWQQKRSYSKEEVLEFTQTMIMQYKFGNTNIEQMDLLKETLQLFKNK